VQGYLCNNVYIGKNSWFFMEPQTAPNNEDPKFLDIEGNQIESGGWYKGPIEKPLIPTRTLPLEIGQADYRPHGRHSTFRGHLIFRTPEHPRGLIVLFENTGRTEDGDISMPYEKVAISDVQAHINGLREGRLVSTGSRKRSTNSLAKPIKNQVITYYYNSIVVT